MNRFQSELFTELSDEQQEIISGGINMSDLINTNFFGKQEALAFQAGVQSGPGGSTVSQQVAANLTNIDTSAAKNFTLNFDPGTSTISL